MFVAINGVRPIAQDYAPSCFHSASTKAIVIRGGNLTP